MGSQIAVIDDYRTLDSASISGTFAAVGSPFTHLLRLICITNNTDGDLIFTTNIVSNQLFIAKNSFKLFDLSINKEGQYNDEFHLPKLTQFYVKQKTAPTAGDVYIEAIYGLGD